MGGTSASAVGTGVFLGLSWTGIAVVCGVLAVAIIGGYIIYRFTKGDEPSFETIEDLIARLAREGINIANWDDICGVENIKKRLLEITESLRFQPDDFYRFLDKAVLLYGPTGVGKTFLASGVAGLMGNGSTFINIPTGVIFHEKYGSVFLKSVFEYAKDHQPTIIFFDEAEPLFQKRDDARDSSFVISVKNTFYSLLTEYVDNASRFKIFVLAATNRPQDFDSSLARRFTLKLHVQLPKQRVRKQIIAKLLSSSGLLDSQIQAISTEVAAQTHGFSPSDLNNLHRNAIRLSQPQALSLPVFQTALQSIRPSVSDDEVRDFKLYQSSH